MRNDSQNVIKGSKGKELPRHGEAVNYVERRPIMGSDKGTMFRLGFSLFAAGIIDILAKRAFAPSVAVNIDIIAMFVGVGLIVVPAFRMIMDWKRM